MYGSQVEKARELLGSITQEELAELILSSQATVSRWEAKPDEKIPVMFSQRIKRLQRRIKRGLPLREAIGLPSDAIELRYPEGCPEGQRVWTEHPKKYLGRLRRTRKGVSPAAANSPDEGTPGTPPPTAAGSEGPQAPPTRSSESAASTAPCQIPSSTEFRLIAAGLAVVMIAVIIGSAFYLRNDLMSALLSATNVEAPRASVLRTHMGERKTGLPVPRHALPGMAVAPCQGSETTIYGQCWVQTNQQAPCPPDLYEYEKACYIPVHDDVPAHLRKVPLAAGPQVPAVSEAQPGGSEKPPAPDLGTGGPLASASVPLPHGGQLPGSLGYLLRRTGPECGPVPLLSGLVSKPAVSLDP